MADPQRKAKRPEDYTLGQGEVGGIVVPRSTSENLLIINQVTHRRLRGPMITADRRVSRRLSVGGDAYVRSIEADSAWAPVVPTDCWVKTPGLLFIRNDENAEKRKEANLCLGLLFDPTPDSPGGRDMHSPPKKEVIIFPLARIRAGEALPIEPIVELERLILATEYEESVKYSIFVYPS